MQKRFYIYEIWFPAIIYSFLYYIYKLPIQDFRLGFNDDSETLYHTLNIYLGKTPYLDDYSHHFLGYILPFYLVAKLDGFSYTVYEYVRNINQISSGILMFFVLKEIKFNYLLCLLGGSILISVREPWVLGFFQQYQINFLTLIILIFTLKYFNTKYNNYIYTAFFFSGVAFTWDQRALLLIFIPSITIFYNYFLSSQTPPFQSIKRLVLSYVKGILIYLIWPIFSLYYLYHNGAYQKFIEQTIIFPFFHRSGSKTIYEIIVDTFHIYEYLITGSPILFLISLFGFILLIFVFLRSYKKNDNKIINEDSFFKKISIFIKNLKDKEKIFFLTIFLLIPSILMPILGGRNFENYSITVFPVLTIFYVYGIDLFSKNKDFIFKFILGILSVIPILLSLQNSINNLPSNKYTGDGIYETVDYLNNNLTTRDNIFVWGYRLDVYVYLAKLGAFPFANQILIHPDNTIVDEENRKKHVYTKYEEEFNDLINNHKPRFIILFERENSPLRSSKSDILIRKIVDKDYILKRKFEKKDFKDKECIFQIYEIKS